MTSSAPSSTADAAPDEPDDTPRPTLEHLWRRWGPAVALVTTMIAVAAIGIVVISSNDGGTPAPKPDIPLDAWAPYWGLDDSLAEFDDRVGSMREVSPFWFNATGVGSIEVDPNTPVADAEAWLDIARSSDAAVIPSIVDSLPAGEMAAILADPVTRTAHVETLLGFADEGDYDGLDINYEQFAFADGRDTWEATRPNWVAFIEELSVGLEADGRTLTVSIPPVYDAEQTGDSGFWVYDHGAIAEYVDRIRIMAYDFSVGDPGPIAPLEWVETAITGTLAATDAPDRLVLGLPAYGRNWPIATEGECPPDDTPGRTTVTARNVDDLVARRSALPQRNDATGEWFFEYDLELTDGTNTCVQTRRVHYVDGDGIAERMDLAREYQLDGVALWALGFDSPAVWDAILPTVSDTASSTTGP
ncbi:MAG: glycosyl hydrolase family 18 protein [Actinomycetota bacterium]